ncbi:MAG: DUF3592 domain-containing protein [Anaerohalosphaera sp.]|nr:DUF3592 domain-containing protein [Anaerohalosphaera sp.]
MVEFSFRRQAGRTASFGGKLFSTLFFLVFAGMGSFFMVLTVRDYLKTLDAASWDKTQCTIVESSVDEDFSDNNDPFVFKVTYRYEYQGSQYSCNVYRRSYGGDDDYAKANRKLVDYPADKQAFCYVNPANPRQAVLKKESLASGFIILFPVPFMAVGFGGIYFTWRRKRVTVDRDGKVTGKAIVSGNKKKKYENVFGFVFFGIFLAAGLGILWPLAVKPIKNTISAQSWTEVPCRVVNAAVRSHDSDDGVTYSVDIFYEYEYEGKTYKSNRYSFMGGSSSGYQGKKDVVQRYKNAANPVCFVNPDKPHEAVLKHGWNWEMLFALFPLPFIAVGLGGIIYMIRNKGLRAKKSAADSYLPADRTAPATLVSDRLAVGGEYYDKGTVVLKSKGSPFVRFLGITAFALFWNGIVFGLLVREVVQGHRSGNADWFMTLFAVPFVAVGIGTAIAAIYCLLAMKNPRPTLTLSAARIPLAGAGELGWTFKGRADRINKLIISVQGTESATYRQGTDTRTDTSVFYNMPLIETELTDEIFSGQIGFVIPDHTMHSFESDNNKIIWSIVVAGDIRRWPDVKEQFNFTVTPIEQ